MGWKEVAVNQIRTIKDKDEKRKLAQRLCKENCHVINYNYHCPRCKLVKALNSSFLG